VWCSTRRCWSSLDPGDDDLGVLLHLLAMALDPVLPGGCPSLRNLLSAGLPGAAEARRAVGVLVNDVLAADPGPVLVVLDDLHVITDPDALTALGYLLDHAPPAAARARHGAHGTAAGHRPARFCQAEWTRRRTAGTLWCL
jgi:ATP/maltotriose-dependent transcriptional regulator MalT